MVCKILTCAKKKDFLNLFLVPPPPKSLKAFQLGKSGARGVGVAYHPH